MAERFVYLNGDYVPERDAKVSVLDRGFRWGDTVYDATRTFDGRLFKLHEHVERFFRSLRYARIDRSGAGWPDLVGSRARGHD